MEQTMISSAHANGPHYPDTASVRRSSAPKRKNIKKHEWVLVHQHLLQRIKKNKNTIFVMHGVKQDWRNVHSMPLLRLPSYIELRSPPPDPSPLPQFDVDDTELDPESSPQRLEKVPALMSPRTSQTISDRQSDDELNSEKEADELAKATEAFLCDLPLSKVLNSFRRPNWSQSQETSFSFPLGSFDRVTAQRGDSLEAFVDRLYNSGCPVRRMRYFEIILMLLRENHVSTSHFLETIVRGLNGREVEILKEFSWAISIREFGARALGTAACRNDFKAVDVLLFKGADINGNVSDPHDTEKCCCQISVMAYAQLPRFNEEEPGASDDMIAYLLGRGGQKSMTAKMCHLGLLRCVLKQYFTDDDLFLSEVQSVVQRIHAFADIDLETESVLETHILESKTARFFIKGSRQVFEYLVGHGFQRPSGSALAALIYNGGPRELVEKLLAKIVDINAYCNSPSLERCSLSFTSRPWPYHTIQFVNPLQAACLQNYEKLVRLLLQNNAEVNCPARGSCGATPLQAICCLTPESSEDSKLRIVKLLLDCGANVNAAPAWKHGLSALQAAVFVGNLQTVEYLVDNGADVNAPACKYGGATALAFAARSGYADMVRCLLRAGAAIPAVSAEASSSPAAYMFDDNRMVLDFLRISAPDLATMGVINGTCSRDYHEYEAEWADDPTYENNG